MARWEETAVRSVQEFITYIQCLPMNGRGWIFRGQADQSYRLVPKAGRAPFQGMNDLDLFDGWRRKAVAYLASIPIDEWEALAIAQHHGLATRLLDWSFKYVVALYFAVKENCGANGAVYCYYPRRFDENARPRLSELSTVCVFAPSMTIPRIVAQQGVFTCHPKPDEPLESSTEIDDAGTGVVVIPARAKPQFLLDLDALGINEASMFPDLDGLSRHMNRRAELGRGIDRSVLAHEISRIFGTGIDSKTLDELLAKDAEEFLRRSVQAGGE